MPDSEESTFIGTKANASSKVYSTGNRKSVFDI